jgi:hypothetical protein
MSRRKNHESEGNREVTVDATLEADLGVAEGAIEAYLEDRSVTRRDALLAALQLLDQQIELSDDYEGRIAGSAAFGYASKGSVIGETSSASAAEEVPEAELVAQTVLIKAAKREVAAPTPETLVDLRAASQALADVRSKEPPTR